MKTKLISSLFIAAAAVTGALSNAASASAFTWNNAWTQPTITSEPQNKFNNAPYQKYVQKERVQLSGSGQFELNPANLFLKFAYSPTAYFLNEGASYRNQLAFSSTGATNTSGLLFNDLSCSNAKKSGCVLGSKEGTLKLGDSVKLGKIKGESQLDFFLRADGYDQGGKGKIYGTQVAQNPDKLQHVVAYAIDKRYLLLGFEDLPGELGKGSDRDFNDTVVMVDIGENNFKYITGQKVPEPSVTLSLLGVGAAGVFLRRRRQKGNVAE